MTLSAHVAELIAGARERDLREDAIDAAKQALVDWFAASAAAMAETPSHLIGKTAEHWGGNGNALSLFGARGPAAATAFVNATLAHWIDYDDLHLASGYHASAPSWATALAMGMDRQRSEAEILTAYVVGFEVGAQLGNHGLGIKIGHAGWHPSTVLAPFSAAAAAASLLHLHAIQCRHAMAIAAGRVGGVNANSGSMAKPTQLGLATMDGVIAAELAASGITGDPRTLDDPATGIFPALLHEAKTAPDPWPVTDIWQVSQNSFKPYACCQLTHAVIDAARTLYPQFQGRAVETIDVLVNPFAVKIAGKTNPQTPNDAEFSIAFCVALGLAGHHATLDDFSEQRIADPHINHLADHVTIATGETTERWSARVEIIFTDHTTLSLTVPHALGSLGRPMTWDDLEKKFLATAPAIFGRSTDTLLKTLKHFDRPGSRRKLEMLLEPGRITNAA